MTEPKSIPIDKLHIDPANIRSEPNIDPKFIDSIRDGVMQNLIVRPHGDGFGVIVGSRRFVAAKAAGLEKVPCVVREDLEGDDEGARDLSFKENEHREDLENWERREHIMRRYRETDGRKTKEKRVKEVARRLDLSRRTVRQFVDVSEKLDSTLISRLKKPEKRSDTDKKLLETVFSEKLGLAPKSKGFDSEKEKAKGFPSLREIPVRVAEELVKSPFFVRLQEEDKEKAHELASDAADAGQRKVSKVIRKYKRELGEAKRKKHLESAPEPKRLTIVVGQATVKALDEFIEKHEKKHDTKPTRSQAVVDILCDYFEEHGYFPE